MHDAASPMGQAPAAGFLESPATCDREGATASREQLEQLLAARTRELAALSAIAIAVSQSLDLGDVLSESLTKTLEVTGAQAAGIYLLDEATHMLHLVAQRGFPPPLAAEIDNLKVGEGFSGQVAQTGQPLVVRDISLDGRLTRPAVADEGLRSLAIVPLESRGRVLGTLFVLTRTTREFTEQNIQLLAAIGHHVGVAVENARLFQAEQRRAEQFRVVGEVGRRIASILDTDELLKEIVRLLKESFGYYLVTIGLVEGDQIVFKAGLKTGWEESQFIPPGLSIGGPGITAWVAASGLPLLAPDVRQEPRYVLFEGIAETRSELAVPLKTKSGVIGVLNVESSRLNAFDESDLIILQSLAQQAAIAIENARLYEQAQQLAVIEERQRLARELHDAVTQTLFSSSLLAEALPDIWEMDQGEGRKLLQELRQLSRGALAEMRSLLLELRPAALAETRLQDLLRHLANAVTGRTGVPVTVRVEGDCNLPRDVHLALYRIAQEALNNVVKHAAATHVTVRLRSPTPANADKGAGECRDVELQVQDDGRGFDVSKVSVMSLGLEIIRERAQAVGARADIASAPGEGTRVTVVWKEE